MADENGFSCFLIGGDTLLGECGAMLLERGHTIRGVIADAPRIAAWAHEHDLEVASVSSDYAQLLASRPYDYLFSITHLRMIPEAALRTPSRAAINFHDGPLPRYAGLNAPAWALMNREPRYGITWHTMTGAADEGDVLAQVEFDVAPGETSLSINTRCFAAAIDSFGALVDRLASGETAGTPQDLSLRSYFGRHDKPDAAGSLIWTRDAEELEARVRALDFGPYENPLSVARVLGEGVSLNVTAASARPGDETTGEPGDVLDVSAEGIAVRTAGGSLLLSGFTSATGAPLDPVAAAARLGVAAGDAMPAPDGALVERLTALGEPVSKAESFWRRRLERFEPVELPYGGATRAGAPAVASFDVEVPGTFRLAHPGSGALAAAALVWLGRVGGRLRFTVPLRGLLEREAGAEAMFSEHALLEAALDRGDDFTAHLARVSGELRRLRDRQPWLLDTIARHPSLSAQARLRAGELADVEIALVDGAATAAGLSHGAALAFAIGPDGRDAALIVDTARIAEADAAAIADQLTQLLASLADGDSIGRADLLGPALRQRMLHEWNETALAGDDHLTLDTLFARQAERTPERPAVTFEGESLDYAELDRLSNGLAHQLIRAGVRGNDLVGIYVERSLELPLAVLGTLKAGAAYVPLDPAYPRARIALMIEDSGLSTILTTSDQVHTLPSCDGVEVIRIDRDPQQAEAPPETAITGESLGYVIYTSGSTGRPKGVMVEHRNVVNFFQGMDAVIERENSDAPGVWFAVTSLSFDISVLELLWTLTRGFEVVVHLDRERGRAGGEARSPESARHIDFGLFYWGNDDGPGRQKYRLLLDGARFADQNGFAAVWTPERHFHAFGGPYPNPAVTGAAVAATTQNLEIRAGSCVIPLHSPIRVAEEWAVIDNLSNGRVALGIASGWQPNDFVFAPDNFKENKTVMLEYIEKLRSLWRGDPVDFRGPLGDSVAVTSQPRPVQAEVPIWLTTAGNPDTYRAAAQARAHVLTHLLGQSLEEVGEKIALYRETLREEGLDPADFKVTLMLHTFVGEDTEHVRELVRQPMKEYLGSSVSLVKNFAWAFPAFKRPQGLEATADDIDLDRLSEEEVDTILDHAFDRYFETSGLFGDVERCVEMAERCKAIGVDEIACLIDYGVPTDRMLAALPLLKQVLDRSQAISAEVRHEQAQAGVHSLPEQFRRHGVTHLQCTPSMARMLLSDDESRAALGQLRQMLVGGEAMPPALAQDLGGTLSGGLTNMYGPTATTIWSSTQPVAGDGAAVPIGRPIANTRLYVLDEALEPVPPGVPGELYIGGDGVVRGYLGRPELTAERFLADPFAEVPGARMYRTGDLVRHRPDGVLDFIGRTDHQVKIRGHRIELGEIEARLAECTEVQECVAIVREDTPGEKRIVAYWVAEAGAVADAAALRDRLRESLPEYMVPGHLVLLPALPLTPNGKLDRRALPAPDAAGPAAEQPYVAPENELERTLVELWQEVLGLERVGTQDNFFDIGGHSLLVVKLHRELNARIDRPVALTDLYRFTTIRALTGHLSSDAPSEGLTASTDRAQRRREAMQQRRRRRGGKR